jgi:hypothetical protein
MESIHKPKAEKEREKTLILFLSLASSRDENGAIIDHDKMMHHQNPNFKRF